MTDATHIARRLLADELHNLSLQVRSGKAPHWAVIAVASSVRMIAHILCGPRGKLTNVHELAPWARAHDGAENARHVIDVGALRGEP